MSVEAETATSTQKQDRLGDIYTRVSELEDDAANEQVEELLDVIRVLVSECKRIDAQKRNLQHRVNRLEVRFPQSTKGPESNSSPFDARDQRVIEAIDSSSSDRIEIRELRGLYRRHTDIRNSRTLGDRIRHITTAGPFKLLSPGLWEYQPDTD